MPIGRRGKLSASVVARIIAAMTAVGIRLLLTRAHDDRIVSVRAFIIITVVAVAAGIAVRSLAADTARRPALWLGITIDIGTVAAVAYAAGLGPMLTGFGALVVMIDPLGRRDERALRPILAVTLSALVAGQLCIAGGVAPSAIGRLDSFFAAALIAWSVAMVEEAFSAGHRKVAGIRGTLALSEAHNRTLIEHGSEIVLVLDSDAVPTYAAPSYGRVLGMAADERVAQHSRAEIHPDDRGRFEETWRGLLGSPGSSVVLELRIAAAGGNWRWMAATLTNLFDDPAVGGVVLNAHDITDEKEARDALDRATLYDPITGLANRRTLAERLARLLAASRRTEGRLLVLFIEIDEFELHDRAHGPAAMDELVLTTARRLEQLTGAADILARVGRHQFVLVTELSHEETVSVANMSVAIADRAARMLSEPLIIGGSETYVTSSIGVTSTDPGETDPDRVVSDAELAMRSARRDGGDRVALFGPADEQRAVSRVKMSGALRRALVDGDLRVHFQPIVHLKSGEVRGAEALLRWEHPGEGLIMPDQFVPVAEASGLIVSIGTWVLERSCEIVAAATTRNGMPLYVSVNISGRQLDDSELDATVERVLIDTSLDPGLLTLEVTESALPTDVLAAIERLEPLRRLGVRIAIDDFGTGYSSLGYLKQLRPDVIKIDRSFIAGFLADPGDRAIIAAVVNLGKAVGIEVLAEGIETEAQAIALLETGCDFGQGYLFGRPAYADAASFAALVGGTRRAMRDARAMATITAVAR
jgi:diguanylate cyclase (GGDEF)-like protein/PAS domain S-box-containing protein